MKRRPVIVWVRQDLRLADHPALNAAVGSGAPVIHAYVHDEATPGEWAPGGASRWWLHHSLHAFSGSLAARGGRLVLRRGNVLEMLPALAAELEARAVYWSRGHEPRQVEVENSLAQALQAGGVEARAFDGALLFEPGGVLSRSGRPFKVFTPFWKACRSGSPPALPLRAPDRIDRGGLSPATLALEDLGLAPTRPDWSAGLREAWTPGEEPARNRLASFAGDALVAYAEERDRPDRDGTSRLSAHLHFGEISPRQVWHEIAMLAQGDPGLAAPAQSFLRELAWREFSYHLLHQFPALPERPFRDAFRAFAWRDDDEALHAWQRGLTGYPLVDAGMRELWSIGWMHNRVRMVTASFLTKHLLLPWQRGEAWFWDTLVDADLANNAASWQWVAGCGADAAPFFRIFNPVLQGAKFDPHGVYVRRWVPELAKLPDRYLHQPWAAPGNVLSDAGVRLGETYPLPIVDHGDARARALTAFAALDASRSRRTGA